MKLKLLAIFFITLVCYGNATTVMRAEKKVKTGSKTKEDGGSYADGFNCPDILIAKGKEAYVSQGGATFWAKKLELPTTAGEKNGLCFKFKKAPGANLMLFLVQDADKYCLQFRYITSKPTYTNPWGDNKYMIIELKDDQKNPYTLQVKYPYAALTWYINDDEGNKICNLLDGLRNQLASSTSNAKAKCRSCANNYKNAKTAADTATGAADDQAKIVKKFEEERDALVKQAAAQSTVCNGLKQQVAADSDKEKTLTNDLEKARDNLNNLSQENEALTKSLTAANDTSKSQADKLKTATDDSNKALQKFNTEVDVLTKQAPQRSDKIAAAKTANERLDTKGVNDNVDAIKS